MRITTLTMNPSLDRTVQVETLDPGAVHRVPAAVVEAAGKGVNVSRGLMAGGVDTVAVVACGSEAGRGYLNLLADIGMDVRVVDTGRPVRCNISLIEQNGRTTKLNEPGFAVETGTIERVLEAVSELAADSDWVAASGSLPPAVAASLYAELADRLAQTGGTAKLAVDTSGSALAAMVNVPCALLKPNRSELESVAGATINTIGDAIAAARRLVAGGAESVLASLGADGALLVTATEVVGAMAPAAQMSNTVGAGDSLLAGFLAVGGSGIDALVEGSAWARAALRSTSTEMAQPTDEDRRAVMSTVIEVDGTVVDPDLMGRELKDKS